MQSASNVSATAALCSSVRGVCADECLSGKLSQCGLFARDEISAQLGYYVNAFRSSKKKTLSLFDSVAKQALLLEALADIVER